MANYCDYEMKIKGKKENVDKMISYLQAEYSHRENNIKIWTADKHFFNVDEANVIERYDNNMESEVIVSGYCNWSVSTCMFDDNLSYYRKWSENDMNDGDLTGTHIQEVTRELDLEVEIFSKELGVGFMEHYIVKNGIVEREECVDCYELYDENEEAILDENGDIEIEGGMEWVYSI